MKLFDSNPAAIWLALLGGFSTSLAYALFLMETDASESFALLLFFLHVTLYTLLISSILRNDGALKIPLKERARLAALLLLAQGVLPASVWSIKAVLA